MQNCWILNSSPILMPLYAIQVGEMKNLGMSVQINEFTAQNTDS